VTGVLIFDAEHVGDLGPQIAGVSERPNLVGLGPHGLQRREDGFAIVPHPGKVTGKA
jgi:hypothetical protein